MPVPEDPSHVLSVRRREGPGLKVSLRVSTADKGKIARLGGTGEVGTEVSLCMLESAIVRIRNAWPHIRRSRIKKFVKLIHDISSQLVLPVLQQTIDILLAQAFSKLFDVVTDILSQQPENTKCNVSSTMHVNEQSDLISVPTCLSESKFHDTP